MTAGEEKPIPTPRGEEKTFFAAAGEGRLLIQRCTACGDHVFYPRAVCPRCHAESLAWVEAAGTGTVYSFSILHRAGRPGFQNDVPYVVALIDLAEGPRMMGNLLEIDPAEVRVGLAVRVTFEDRRGGVVVPQWVPL